MDKSSSYQLLDGNRIPAVGFGTARLLGEKAIRSIQWALELGYRHIDTASYYENEEAIGKAIRTSKVPRKDLFIVSKIWPGEFDEPDQALERTLDKLDLEYLDLYLIHWPGSSSKWKQVWRDLIQFKDDGLCKSIGVSSFSPANIDQIVEDTQIVPAVNQVELSPYVYRDQLPLIEYCNNKDIHLTAFSPLNEGKKLNHPDLLAIVQKYQISASQVLLRWGLQRGYSVIPKSKNKERIAENIDLFTFTLDAQDLQILEGMA